ncbi:uncharacterized protein LOC112589767 [Harpegnathos saltator]|uniref:uncharacterized protein LOC112589767 n=1 Tax=Harpegnathos saltator TaxID=610380 RepID=UPI000DBEF1E0|nr:uncharacterized protein LOC112589767 [Harpegnathos saltator]
MGALTAQSTVFRCVLSGPLSGSVVPSSSGASVSFRGARTGSPSLRINTLHYMESLSLESELRRFWELEEVFTNPILNLEDEKCEEHFRTSHSRDESGRYIVRITFREGPPIRIGESRAIAENLLHSLHRRFHAHPGHKVEYVEFLRDYEEQGHMREAGRDYQLGDQVAFILHHPVIHASSATTCLRVVFNASSVFSNDTSLNDHQLIGPKLQTEMPACCVGGSINSS